MEQYTVTGMSCAACSARVEKAVSAVDGVKSCSVSLLTNSMGVEGTATADEIIAAVEKAGYSAKKKNSGSNATKSGAANSTSESVGKSEMYAEAEESLQDRETPKLRKRLIVSLVFLCVLMYFSMGHMMWGWPLPEYFNENHIAMGLVQLLLTIIIMVINQRFFISGFKSLLHGAPNMDTLVALGSGAAFVYSVYSLFAMTDAQVKGNGELVMMYMHEFYFESAAMILTLITLGKMLEAHSKGKTTDALKSLMRLAPKMAVVLRKNSCQLAPDENNDDERLVHEDVRCEEIEIQVPIEEVRIGDIFVVKPGENIPVDGVVIEGSSAVNEAALTGESIPVDKTVGDQVSAATTNQSGYLKCEARRVGEDTSISQIIQMVSDAAATKAPIAKIADRVSGIFVPAVIVIAVITIAVWLIVGQTLGFALARGISVLVISCPCALGLATPVAIMVGNGMGAKNGILFKTASSLEVAGKTQIIALDKTGTITNGTPVVTDIFPEDGVTEDELFRKAASLEAKSEHPLAKAVLQRAAEKTIEIEDAVDFEVNPGNGLCGKINGKEMHGGNLKYISQFVAVSDKMLNRAEQLAEEGKTPLFFEEAGKLLGIIAVADTIKEDCKDAVEQLKAMGIRVVMLTGDNEKTARAIGAQAGVDEVIAEVLPEGKENVVRQLQEQGRVAMVGDGINDALALTRADIGIAIGAGTDVAIDAADVVLMKSRLIDVPAAIRLSRQTLRNIHENLFWAFFYNTIGIPLAAGAFIPVFEWKLNPMFGAAAMSLSSFCVVTNALRLNLFKLYETRCDKKIKQKREEKKEMTKTMKIEGMMCGHCEARVKKTLESIEGVTEAAVSHETGTAVVTLSEEVPSEVLKDAVEAQDYKVLLVE